MGTTSACAENTSRGWFYWPRNGNYLRVRGEYMGVVCGGWFVWELPPRARRILSRVDDLVVSVGTTSACAENTWLHIMWCLACGNYLRVRGEYSMPPLARASIAELPPRARRIQVMGVVCGGWFVNYLRVRGEYISIARFKSISWELPPRARRILPLQSLTRILNRTTSACAENTK